MTSRAILAAGVMSLAAAADAAERTLIDFGQKGVARKWQTVNDNVMGGRSSGGPSFEGGVLTFAGRTVTRGGGFSSIRTRRADYKLGGAKGLVIRFKGDGRTYKADIQTGQRRGSIPVAYRADFKTKAGAGWREVRIPFAEFKPTIFGRPLSAACPLRPAAVKTLGFMIYDKKDGPFKLQVDWIKAY